MPGRHADVEARFVVDQDDVRRFGRRLAGGGDRLQAIGGEGVGLHQSVRHQFRNGIDAGARERGNEIAAVEGLERLHRELHFERGEAAEAISAKRRRRIGGRGTDRAARPARRAAPAREDQRHDPAQRREDREQEADGVGIDDHQVDEIRRHHQHVVFELRQQNQAASSSSATASRPAPAGRAARARRNSEFPRPARTPPWP